MSFVSLPSELFDSPEQTLLLTSSQRLAMHSLEAIAEHQKKLDRTWRPASVFSLNRWYNTLWSRYKSFFGYSQYVLLTPYQEQQLWKKIIKSDESGASSIVNFTNTAHKVSNAYKLAEDWALPAEEFLKDVSPDPVIYHAWATAFDSYCEQHSLMPSCRLPRLLSAWFEKGIIPLKSSIYFMGFEEITPSLKLLLASISDTGATVHMTNHKDESSDYEYLSYHSETEEIRSVVNDVAQSLQDEPRLKIGIMAPDMTLKSASLVKHLSKSLHELNKSNNHNFTLKTSVGEVLNQLPMVDDFIKIISLPHSHRPVAEVLQLFKSSYFSIEFDGRHQFAQYLEIRGVESVSIKDILYHYHRYSKQDTAILCDDFIAKIKAFLTLEDDSRSASHWVKHWLEMAHHLGWCNGSTMTSVELEQYNGFINGLNDFTSVGLIEPNLTRYTALKLVRSFLAQSKYYPAIRNPTVYLLSSMEGASLEFDRLYFIGVDDTTWPNAPSPNPFIPVFLQKEYSIPHASSERELHFAKLLTNRILSSSKQLKISFSKHVDGVEVSKSPIFDLSDTALQYSAKSSPQKTIPVTWVEDNKGLTLSDGDLGKGGTSALKDQASCPFKAHATHRLGLKDYRKVESGLSAADRGNLLHNILESFWRRVNSHEQLQALSPEARYDIIHELVNEQVTQIETSRSSLESSTFLKIERNRLTDILQQWLDLELKRQPFKVASVEETVTVKAGPLTLNMKLDRKDVLDDGSSVLIDYKTGKVTPSHWAGDRPHEPQMPLYALAESDPISGIAFASIRPEKHSFVGVSKKENLLPGVLPLHKNGRLPLPSNWDDMLEYWKKTLDSLAKDYFNGVATVNPVNLNVSCKYCHLSATCRINEELPQNSDDLLNLEPVR